MAHIYCISWMTSIWRDVWRTHQVRLAQIIRASFKPLRPVDVNVPQGPWWNKHMLILSSINSLHIKVWAWKRRGLDTSAETGPAISYVPAHMIPLLPALPPVICWVLQASGNICSHSRWCRGFCGPTCACFLIFILFFFNFSNYFFLSFIFTCL